MKKNYNNLLLIILIILFGLLFNYNSIIKYSIIESSKLWFYNLVPFILPMYLFVDLLLNYGLGEFLYKIFKNNYSFLIIINMLLGTPSNAKYIKEFYQNGNINLECANWLLLFSYSPNPLFILGISPNKRTAFIVLSYIYFTNILIAILSKKYFDIKSSNVNFNNSVNFSKCLETSILKSFNVLIIILGIICFYNILNTFIDLFVPNNVFLKIILEMTTALNIILNNNENVLLLMILSVSFAGFSIHTQIKSILEDTSISYKYFVVGRILSSIPILFLLIVN